jgi:hypothetical protein
MDLSIARTTNHITSHWGRGWGFSRDSERKAARVADSSSSFFFQLPPLSSYSEGGVLMTTSRTGFTRLLGHDLGSWEGALVTGPVQNTGELSEHIVL